MGKCGEHRKFLKKIHMKVVADQAFCPIGDAEKQKEVDSSRSKTAQLQRRKAEKQAESGEKPFESGAKSGMKSDT